MIKAINFKVGTTIFDIKIINKLVFIMGLSGIGKTFFFNSYRDYVLANRKENSIYFYNYADLANRKYIYERMQNSKGKLFVIDNADLLISEKMKKFISNDSNNQYLIFTRNLEGYLYCRESIASMKLKDNKLYLDYIFKSR